MDESINVKLDLTIRGKINLMDAKISYSFIKWNDINNDLDVDKYIKDIKKTLKKLDSVDYLNIEILTPHETVDGLQYSISYGETKKYIWDKTEKQYRVITENMDEIQFYRDLNREVKALVEKVNIINNIAMIELLKGKKV